MKLTKPRRRVLKELSRRGGKATNYDLAYPRAHMMHSMFMLGWLSIEGPTDGWGEPSGDGVWLLTDAGRSALNTAEGGDE